MRTTPPQWRNTMVELDSEFKDPLTVIKFTAEELAENLAVPDADRRKVRLILTQVQRIVRTLKKATDAAQRL